MPDFLAGNYDLPEDEDDQKSDDKSSKSLTEIFEEKALAHLGGSICFVRTSKKFIWSGETDE